jgi:hypothetical protein
MSECVGSKRKNKMGNIIKLNVNKLVGKISLLSITERGE